MTIEAEVHGTYVHGEFEIEDRDGAFKWTEISVRVGNYHEWLDISAMDSAFEEDAREALEATQQFRDMHAQVLADSRGGRP